MFNFQINYPSPNYEKYVESMYNFCKENKFSMILKGSLAKGTATKFSDINIIILGNIDGPKVDEIISVYDTPVMTNLTQNPDGILVLIYDNNLCVDLDIRQKISQQDLLDSIVLLKYDSSFIIDNRAITRKLISSRYMPNRPEWYKILGLLHRGTIKYLSKKTDSAYALLYEIRESLIPLKITDLTLTNNFRHDIKHIFNKLCEQFKIDPQIKALFNNLFNEF